MFWPVPLSHRVQIGGGVNVGPGHASKKAAGFSFGWAAAGNLTLYSKEWAEMVGTLFRLPRVFAGLDADKMRNKILGRVLRKLKDPDHDPDDEDGGAWINPPDPADTDMLIKIMHEFGNVSVGQLKINTTTYKGNGSLSGIAGLRIAGWGPGVGAGLGAELTKISRKWRETGGVVNQKKDAKETEFKVSVSGLLNLLVFTVKAVEIRADELDKEDAISLKDLLDPEAWSGAFKASFQDGVMASADVFRTGTAVQNTWISYDDAYNYTPGLCSFSQKVYLNAASYKNFLVKRFAQLAEDKARVLNAYEYYLHEGRTAHDAVEKLKFLDHENRAIAKEIVALLRELRKTVEEAKPTQKFRKYDDYPPIILQLKNDLEGLIKSEMSIPGWDKNSLARQKIKDYKKQIKKLESLDYKLISRYTDFRFPIKDNVESKKKERGVYTTLIYGRQRSLSTTRIDGLA